jgi:integrase
MIWICGRTDTIIVPRHSTGTTDMAVAEAKRAKLLAKGQDEAVHGLRLADAVQKYIASRDDIAADTRVHYVLALKWLEDFCAKRSIYFIRQLTVDLVEDFKSEGMTDQAETSRVVYVAKVRRFLRDAYRRGWITEPLADRVRPAYASYEPGEPYKDEEVALVLDAAGKLNRGQFGYSKHPKAFRLLLELMLETGMRIGDAIQFDPAKLSRGEHLWIYTFRPQKQRRTERRPKLLEAYIRPALKDAIDACWRETGWRLPFQYTAAVDSVQVNKRLTTIGKRVGVADCRPHRWRDTFAVRALLRGVPLEDVSRLLGHSSIKVTEAHYAKWTTARKARLESIVAQSLMNATDNALGNG